MNDFMEQIKRQLYSILSKNTRGVVKVSYSESNRSLYIKIVQTFGFCHKIEEAEEVFVNASVFEVATDIMKRYKRFILDQFIEKEFLEEGKC